MKLVSFNRKHALFIAGIILVPLLLVFYASYRSSGHNTPALGKTQNETPTKAKDGIQEDEKDLGWTANTFSNDDLNGVSAERTILPNGSTQYTFPSDVTNRPQVIRVKNGITIFQRNPVSDTAAKEYTTYYGKPGFFAKGSYFWGPHAITYIYIKIGFAFVVNTQTGMAVEQMYFLPVNEKLYKETYDSDLIGDVEPY